MEVIFMGTGTSQGVPVIACDCGVCTSADARNRRGRCCIHVVMDGLHVQVDAGPEFRLQCLRDQVRWIDFMILTHGHNDHVAGMDDLRRFCDQRDGDGIDIYTTEQTMERVLAMFPYAIMERPVLRGYPAFRLKAMPGVLELPQGTIASTLLPHGGVNTLGLVFTERSSGKRFAYYTDCKRLPREAVALAQGADVAVVDCLRPEPHPSHMSVTEAVEALRELSPKQGYMTHLTHLLEHAALEATLPSGMAVAYDGLRLSL